MFCRSGQFRYRPGNSTSSGVVHFRTFPTRRKNGKMNNEIQKEKKKSGEELLIIFSEIA